MVSLGCRDPKLKHVQSVSGLTFSNPGGVFLRVKYGDGSYTVHASSGQLKCLECGDVACKCVACPHKRHGEAEVSPVVRVADSGGG